MDQATDGREEEGYVPYWTTLMVSGTDSSNLIAVLFWIYGGGFATGSTNNPGYNGQYFADNEDVVVVSAK
jgi:carboxylesterase type B